MHPKPSQNEQNGISKNSRLVLVLSVCISSEILGQFAPFSVRTMWRQSRAWVSSIPRTMKEKAANIPTAHGQLYLTKNENPLSGSEESCCTAKTLLLSSKNLSVDFVMSLRLSLMPVDLVLQGITSLPASTPSYLTAAAPPSKYPPRNLCSVCGYWGSYHCQKCGMFYCTMTCQATHAETRCERRVL